MEPDPADESQNGCDLQEFDLSAYEGAFYTQPQQSQAAPFPQSNVSYGDYPQTSVFPAGFEGSVPQDSGFSGWRAGVLWPGQPSNSPQPDNWQSDLSALGMTPPHDMYSQPQIYNGTAQALPLPPGYWHHDIVESRLPSGSAAAGSDMLSMDPSLRPSEDVPIKNDCRVTTVKVKGNTLSSKTKYHQVTRTSVDNNPYNELKDRVFLLTTTGICAVGGPGQTECSGMVFLVERSGGTRVAEVASLCQPHFDQDETYKLIRHCWTCIPFQHTSFPPFKACPKNQKARRVDADPKIALCNTCRAAKRILEASSSATDLED